LCGGGGLRGESSRSNHVARHQPRLPPLPALLGCMHLQPPFNTEARAAAGFDEAWYLPLAEQQAAEREQQAAARKAAKEQQEQMQQQRHEAVVQQPVNA